MANAAYDTLTNLARVINLPTYAIGLGGNLSINVGIDRIANVNIGAYYRRDTKTLAVRGLDKFKHVAHEWFHALDHYLSYTFGLKPDELMSEYLVWDTEKSSVKTIKNFINLNAAIRNSNFYDISYNNGNIDPYWYSPQELLSRAFEIYTLFRMKELNINDIRLVQLFIGNPYPNFDDSSDKPIKEKFITFFDDLLIKNVGYEIESIYGIK